MLTDYHALIANDACIRITHPARAIPASLYMGDSWSVLE